MLTRFHHWKGVQTTTLSTSNFRLQKFKFSACEKPCIPELAIKGCMQSCAPEVRKAPYASAEFTKENQNTAGNPIALSCCPHRARASLQNRWQALPCLRYALPFLRQQFNRDNSIVPCPLHCTSSGFSCRLFDQIKSSSLYLEVSFKFRLHLPGFLWN